MSFCLVLALVVGLLLGLSQASIIALWPVYLLVGAVMGACSFYNYITAFSWQIPEVVITFCCMAFGTLVAAGILFLL